MGERVLSFDSYEEVQAFINDYERRTTSHFITMKKEKAFSQTEWKGKKLFWKQHAENEALIKFDGVPFVHMGKVILGCHQGKDKNLGKKAKYKQLVAEKMKNNTGKRQITRRFLAQPTKKLDCPAVISIKKVVKFPEYAVPLTSSHSIRHRMYQQFSKHLSEGKTVKAEFKFFMKLPAPDAHKYHIQGEFAGMREPVDPVVKKKVEELVNGGVRKISEIQKGVKAFVVKELFRDQTPPPMTRRRYYPTSKDIRNLSYKARAIQQQQQQQRLTPEHQRLQELLVKWHTELPNDRTFLRCTLVGGNEATNDSMEDIGDSFLFCHQSQHQRRLMSRYGSTVLMDVTFQTTRFPSPVIFLYVRTNVDFQPVGEFIVQSESRVCIHEALSLFREWNPEWLPQYFIVDFCQEKIEAIENLFPGVEVFLSDYRRERAWMDWLSKNENGAVNVKDKVMEHLRRIAKSTTTQQYEEAVRHMDEFWTACPKLQKWFSYKWQAIAKMWVPAFRPERYAITVSVMNGLDKMTELLKTNHLEEYRDSSLYHIVHDVVTQVGPESYRSYVENNLRCSSGYGKYNEALPPYLQNRPRDLINHIKARSPVVHQLIDNVVQLDNGTFTVPNETIPYRYHVVSFGNDTTYPSCDCSDWTHHRLPCKHFLAVFYRYGDHNCWEQLCTMYRNNPLFALDTECITQQMASEDVVMVDVNEDKSAAEILTCHLMSGDNSTITAEADVLQVVASPQSSDGSPEMGVIPSEIGAVTQVTTSHVAATSNVAAIFQVAQAVAATTSQQAKPSEAESSHVAATSQEPTLQEAATDPTTASLQTARLSCGIHLKQLTQLTAKITDEKALNRIASHLEKALRAARRAAGPSDT